MKKLLICASIATMCLLSACGKAPEGEQAAAKPTTEVAANTENATSSAKTEEAVKSASDSDKAETEKLLTIFEKSVPKDFGQGIKRGKFVLTDDNMGILFPVKLARADYDANDQESIDVYTKAIKGGMSSLFCKNGAPAKGMEKFLGNGHYLQFVVDYEGASKAINFRVDADTCRE